MRIPVSSDPYNLYILSLQGGGANGYSSAVFLDLFCAQWGVDPAKLYEVFDIIAGASAGGITAPGLASGLTPAEVATFYRTETPWVFTTSAIFPSVQGTWLDMTSAILLGTSIYSINNFVAKLNEQFGTLKMSELQTNVLIPSFRPATKTLVVFSNDNNTLPFTTGENFFVKDTILAGAALPFYFPTVTLPDTNVYQDGGIWANNPVQLAIAYGKKLKPRAKRICVLSLGVGTGEIGFDNIPPDPPPFTPGLSQVVELVDELLAGPMRGAHLALTLESSKILPQVFYYEFNFVIDETACPNATDNTTPASFDYRQAATENVFANDQPNIQAFIDHLNV